MNHTNETIERIVREIVARLRGGSQGSHASTVCACGCANGGDATAENRSLNVAEFACDDRVVSIASIDGAASGVRKIVFRSGAIVTPAAKDYLRDRGIDWRRADSDQKQVAAPCSTARSDRDIGGRRSLMLGASGCTMAQYAAIDLATRHLRLERTEVGELSRVVKSVAERVADGSRGLIVTDRPSDALRTANQCRGAGIIRAASAADWSRGAAKAPVNLLIVDSTAPDFRLSRSLINRLWE